MSQTAETNKEYAYSLASAFKQVDWLIPAFLTLGFLSKLAGLIEQAPPHLKSQTLRLMLGTAYEPDYLATMLLERYSKIPHVKDFTRVLDEAFKAYFSGYTLVAITSLVPVIEGIVRKMALKQNRDIGRGTRKLLDEFNALVDRERNSPNCYGERLVMLETLRDFMRDRFLESTADYEGLNEFNRHGILHGIFDNYGDDLNFFRIITLLDLLCFSIGLIEGGVSCFAPETTEASSKLAAHYIELQSRGTETEIRPQRV